MRPLKFFLAIFKERKKSSEKEKNQVRKKKRKKESCDLQLAASNEKRKESKPGVESAVVTAD